MTLPPRAGATVVFVAVAAGLLPSAGCRTRLLDWADDGGTSGDAEVALPLCENGRQDPGESDVDCGGCCGPCASGQRCGQARDCANGVCTDGRCGEARCHGCTLDFLSGLPVPIGGAFLVGDFNGDGIPDLAGALGDRTALQIGNGKGAFRQTLLDPTGVAPIAAADFNGDGHLDLVLTGSFVETNIDSGDFLFTSQLEVLLGVGDGSFRAPLAIPVRTEVVSVVAADFDGDGRIDLASAEQVPGGDFSVVVRRGAGDGTFADPIPVADGAGVSAMEAGDFTGDCRPDIAVALGSSRAGILVNQGGGRFSLAATQPIQDGPFSIAVGDFNNDRILDVLVGDNLTPSRAHADVLLGNGDGTLQPTRTFESGFQSTSVACADMNGDGNLDIVLGTLPALGTGPDYPLWMLLGDGRGSFGPPISFGLYRGISQVAVADFNRDGRMDVAFTNYVLLNATD